SRDVSCRPARAPPVPPTPGRGQPLLGVLAEERWAAREAPRARGGNERPAGIEKLPVELGMAHGDPEAAIVEVGIVEVLVGRPDRRPRESLTLTCPVDVVGGVAGGKSPQGGFPHPGENGAGPGGG